jgi:hypothetical protein
MKSYLISILIIGLCTMTSCIETYTPDISRYENILVVDGEISNLPGPYIVKLSRSYEFYKRNSQPAKGAQIKIIENTGLEVELTETSDGIYSTTDNPFRGVVGNSYKLQIKLDGQIYESGFETIIPPMPIDKVYWEYQKKDNGSDGIELLLDTHDPLNKTRNYAWYVDETWKFVVPIEIIDHPEWRVGYQYYTSSIFDIGTSAQRINDIIERHHLRFFDETTNRIYIRYSANVRQYALTEPSYSYFKKIVTINQNQGSLFDPTPGSITGNIKNTQNKDMPVLGYFLVAGVSEKRIFIDRKEVPKTYQPTDGFDDCNTEMVIVPILPKDFIYPPYGPVTHKDSSLWVLYLERNSIYNSLRGYGYVEIEKLKNRSMSPLNDSDWFFTLAKPRCFNCTVTGESEVPAFWTEFTNQ